MIRLSLSLVAVVVFIAACSVVHAQEQSEPSKPKPQGLLLQGDVALWTVAIKPDKTADFERVVQRLRDGLIHSEKAERKQQAAGWRVVKLDKPLPDGNIAYVHIIAPVVPGADYSLMQSLYDEFPAERQSLYDLYRSAFAQNLALSTGTVIVDMSKPQ